MQNITPYANNLFEQPWWLDIVAENNWNEIILKDDEEKIIARMPYVFNNKEIFMPKMTQTIGIWFCEDLLEDLGKTKSVINQIFNQLPDKKNVLISLPPENKYVLPFRWLGYRIMPSFTYRIEDLGDCELLYNHFNKTAKKNIKYARNKVIINTQVDFDRLWGLLDKTFKVQKRKNPIPKELIKKIISICEHNNCGKYFEAVDDYGNIHSCAYFVYDEKVCYYLIGASDSKFRSTKLDYMGRY